MNFLLITLIVLLIICIVYFAKIKKDYINPITIFSFFWVISLFLSSLRLYNMIQYTDKSVILITIGTLSFIVGGILFIIINKNKKNKQEQDEKNKIKIINYTVFNILCILGIGLTLFLTIRVINLMSGGIPYSSIRTLYYSYGKESLINNETLFTIYDWTVNTLINTLSICAVYGVISKTIKKSSFILYILFLVLFIFSSSGRSVLIQIVLYTIVCLVLLYKNKTINELKKHFKKIFALILLFAIAFGAITIARLVTPNKKKQINTFYAYLSAPLPYFSKMVSNIDSNDMQTNGLATFYGPYLIAQKAIKAVTGFKPEAAEEMHKTITMPQNKWVKIFGDSNDFYNAYATMYYSFYLDFRIPGIIVFSFIYGFVLQWVYVNCCKKKNIIWILLYLYASSSIFFSIATWNLASPIFIFSILIFTIITRRVKNG